MSWDKLKERKSPPNNIILCVNTMLTVWVTPFVNMLEGLEDPVVTYLYVIHRINKTNVIVRVVLAILVL